MSSVYRFEFKDEIPPKEIEESLFWAVFNAESVFGKPKVRLDASFLFHRDKRVCVIDKGAAFGEKTEPSVHIMDKLPPEAPEMPSFERERAAADAAAEAKRKKEREQQKRETQEMIRQQTGDISKTVASSMAVVNTNAPSNVSNSSTSSTVNNSPVTPHDMTLVQMAKGIV